VVLTAPDRLGLLGSVVSVVKIFGTTIGVGLRSVSSQLPH